MSHLNTAQSATVALFASDVHLAPASPQTSDAFLHFLRQHAKLAANLFLLGDLFEYWVGDDDLEDAYHQNICAAIHAVAEAGTQVFWLPGNRDFLTGNRFAHAIGATILDEPAHIEMAGRRIGLVHGDAECTDDTAYMAFREQVRQPEWQRAFLARPLSERRLIVQGLRQQSQQEQRTKSCEMMDVHPAAIEALFTRLDIDVLIHGHTHRPNHHRHAYGDRYVLPDWECDHGEPRGGWLSLSPFGTFAFHSLKYQP